MSKTWILMGLSSWLIVPYWICGKFENRWTKRSKIPPLKYRDLLIPVLKWKRTSYRATKFNSSAPLIQNPFNNVKNRNFEERILLASILPHSLVKSLNQSPSVQKFKMPHSTLGSILFDESNNWKEKNPIHHHQIQFTSSPNPIHCFPQANNNTKKSPHLHQISPPNSTNTKQMP